MQQHTLQHLDDAVSEVFTLMLNRDCKPGRCPGPHCPQSPPSISAAIAFSGALSGICRIHLALSTAAILTAELLGAEPDTECTLNADTTGELCNMIAGSWKSRQSTPGDASISAPRIVIGPPTPAPPACNDAVARMYRFENHCLKLELELS